MKTIRSLLALTAFASCGGAFAAADEPKGGGITRLEDASPVMYGRSAKIKATVQAIDLETREVSLKVPKGHLVTLRVEKRVRNLPQVRVGDEVSVRYNQSVALELRKLEDGESVFVPGSQTNVSDDGRIPDESTGPRTVIAEVEAVSTREKTVFLKESDGQIRDVYVRDPQVLASVTAGDQVVATVTEAAVVSMEVQEPKKKKKK